MDDAAPAVDAEPSEAAQEAAAEISAAVVAAQDDSTVDDGTVATKEDGGDGGRPSRTRRSAARGRGRRRAERDP